MGGWPRRHPRAARVVRAEPGHDAVELLQLRDGCSTSRHPGPRYTAPSIRGVARERPPRSRCRSTTRGRPCRRRSDGLVPGVRRGPTACSRTCCAEVRGWTRRRRARSGLMRRLQKCGGALDLPGRRHHQLPHARARPAPARPGTAASSRAHRRNAGRAGERMETRTMSYATWIPVTSSSTDESARSTSPGVMGGLTTEIDERSPTSSSRPRTSRPRRSRDGAAAQAAQ